MTFYSERVFKVLTELSKQKLVQRIQPGINLKTSVGPH